MKIIRPAPIPEAAVIANSVAETVPAWAAGATYDLRARVRDAAAHREYESQQENNTGHPLTDPAWWIEVGATNPWRMFDQANSSQTIAADQIQVDLKISGRVNAVALLNCEAGAAQITASVNGAVVYDKSFVMTATSGISTWYDYFFDPIERRPDLIVTDLPLYSNMDVRVRLIRGGGLVKVGTLVLGQVKDLGLTEIGMAASIVDSSRKVADGFGNVTLVERPFAKKLDAQVLVPNTDVDQVIAALSQLRATLVVWVASERFAAGGVYGFFRNFSVTFAYPEHSKCLLEIEGIT